MGFTQLRPRRIVITAAAALVTLNPVVAQEAPTFRAGVELVTVDVSVIAPDGRPDRALAPDDFVLNVDGRPRPVVSAQFVRQDAALTEEPPLTSRHFSSNEFEAAGRLVVVAVDEEHIRRTEGRAALQAAATFIQSLDPHDRVAVVGLARVGVVEFTRDRAALARRLEQLVGRADPVFLQFNIGLAEAVEVADGNRTRLNDVVLRECGRSLAEYVNLGRATDDAIAGRDACPEQVEQEARAVAQHARTQSRISLSALEALAAALKPLDGPKTLVLLTEGLVADPRLIDLAEFSAAAQDARLAVYVLHIEQPIFEAATDRVSPTFMQDVRLRGDGLSRLAGAARGAVFRLVGGDPAPFRRIANELSGHYLIAFEPLPSERDGRIHRIDISVRRRGPVVRARQAFRIPQTVPSARAREQDLVMLLRSATPVSELPVRVATYAYVEPATPDLRIVISTETDAVAGAPGGVVLGYVLVDGRGVVVASGAHRTPGGREAFTARVPRGHYTLRVGGIDPLGRRGMVERTFAAAVPQYENIQVSDLLLAPVPPTTGAPLHPVVDRIDGGRLATYLELSAVGARPLTDVRVRVRIMNVAGEDTGIALDADVLHSGGLWARARADLPLQALAPGRYVAAAHVSNAGVEIARVTRPFTVP